jgi:hypothetical protein
LDFHVHTNASLLAIGAMLAQNPTSKYDQPIVYASKLLNIYCSDPKTTSDTTRVNKHPPAHHPLDTHYDSVVDEP